MSYPIIDLEITQPLPTLTTTKEQSGIALVVRRYDKAIGFIMKALPPETTFKSEELGELLAQSLKTKLVQESLAEELNVTLEKHHFPYLTVAICTKDRPDNVARCLGSLLKLRTPETASEFEILVVDNAPSDDRTQKLVATLPNVRYVTEPKAGLDFARNRAIEEAKGELLAYLDDDVVVDRQWLKGLKQAWAENPDAGCFTGLVLPYELETKAQILFEQRGGFGRGFEKKRFGQVLAGDTVYPCGAGIFGAGCNMAFKRQVLVKLGGFDEALDTGAPLPGGGDLDIFYRVVRAGYPLVYEPQYLIYHQHRREWEKLRRQYWSWGLGLMAFVMKCYQQDPPQRANLRYLIKWWFKDQLSQLATSLMGHHLLPPEMILAELWGGIKGLLGEYERSLIRSEKIRSSVSATEITSNSQVLMIN